jgi:Ser/Thr protein kinase RdoA (MazF antagonist)
MTSDGQFCHEPFRRAELAHAFGLRRPRRYESLTGGSSPSSVFRLADDDGAWVLKATPLPTDDQRRRMEDGFEFETALADAGVPLPRPRPLRDGGGGVWVHTRPSGETVAITVHEFVDGEPAGYVEPIEVCAPTALAVATALGRAHQIRWRPRAPRGTDHRPGAAGWAAVRQACRGNPEAERVLDALCPMLEFAESVVRAPRTCDLLAPVHADANPHNVLRTRAGICILDWSHGVLMDPQTELASASVVWGCDGDGRSRAKLPVRMVRAYRDTGAVFEAADLTIFRAHLDAMVRWAFALCEVVGGVREDPRTPQWALTQLRETVLTWSPRWSRLPALLEQLQAA